MKKNAPAVLPSDLSPNCLLAMVEEFNKTSHGLIMTLVCICVKFLVQSNLHTVYASILAIFGGKRQLPPIMPPKIKLSAAIFCRRRIFVSLSH